MKIDEGEKMQKQYGQIGMIVDLSIWKTMRKNVLNL